MDVSIIIPIKNGGNRLSQVLDAILQQETKYTFEIVCVDSGSTDQSQVIAKEKGCEVYEILPKEFGHGKTRNLAASMGEGTYIVVITQDAMPVNNNWLESLVDAMEENPQVAGTFGKHLPYPDCNYPDRQMLENHFAQFEQGREQTFKGNYWFQITDENRNRYQTDETYRQYLAFFSDNCSCLRRSVWEKIPYDDVDFAEDQFWARKVLEAGYIKAYCPNAMVYHSHNYSLNTYGKRYFDELKAVYRVYGYLICDNYYHMLRRILGDTRFQCGYIRRQEQLSWTDKIYWYRYSFLRNIKRYHASMLVKKYMKSDEKSQVKMDIKYSQQYVQRK